MGCVGSETVYVARVGCYCYCCYWYLYPPWQWQQPLVCVFVATKPNRGMMIKIDGIVPSTACVFRGEGEEKMEEEMC